MTRFRGLRGGSTAAAVDIPVVGEGNALPQASGRLARAPAHEPPHSPTAVETVAAAAQILYTYL